MEKIPVNVRLDQDVLQRLNAQADRFGLSANAILAAAGYELSRVRPENLFHALGRIAEGEAAALPPPDALALSEPKRKGGRALRP